MLEPLPRESYQRLIGDAPGDIEGFSEWVRTAIAPRNIGGFGDSARNNLYPLDLDALLDAHTVLGMTREQLVARLPALRGV
jgi:hypothetical protein